MVWLHKLKDTNRKLEKDCTFHFLLCHFLYLNVDCRKLDCTWHCCKRFVVSLTKTELHLLLVLPRE